MEKQVGLLQIDLQVEMFFALYRKAVAAIFIIRVSLGRMRIGWELHPFAGEALYS